METVLGERQAIAGVDSREGDLVRANCHCRKENAKSAANDGPNQDPFGQFHPRRAPLVALRGRMNRSPGREKSATSKGYDESGQYFSFL